LAQAKGFFKDEGIKVALLEPNDPSVCLMFCLTLRGFC
jgi:ABC-type nitrate/sulfonate/bicarbonate transport system substrate-binding protein